MTGDIDRFGGYPVDDDDSLVTRLRNATEAHRGLVGTLVFEAKDILMGGLDKLRQSPVGSLELGGALIVSGAAAGVATVAAVRHYR